jgi:hypothetical protein
MRSIKQILQRVLDEKKKVRREEARKGARSTGDV